MIYRFRAECQDDVDAFSQLIPAGELVSMHVVDVQTLIRPLQHRLGMVVADSGYFAYQTLQAIDQQFSVLVTTSSLFKVKK